MVMIKKTLTFRCQIITKIPVTNGNNTKKIVIAFLTFECVLLEKENAILHSL
jgi:hypothetical protein